MLLKLTVIKIGFLFSVNVYVYIPVMFFYG